jgi:Uma2 family endonuclease
MNMEWAEVINNPLLQNLPFKIELNKYGQLLMSPASNWHGSAQIQVGHAMKQKRRGGEVIAECSIQTRDGVKVADVAWASDEFMKKHGYTTPYAQAPEVCVEVRSPSNTQDEIEEKVALYLAAGAQEVWVVVEGNGITYYTHNRTMAKSKLFGTIKVKK